MTAGTLPAADGDWAGSSTPSKWILNFIGVRLAGYESFKLFMADPGVGAGALEMGALAGKVKTPTTLLLLASLPFTGYAQTVQTAGPDIKVSLSGGLQTRLSYGVSVPPNGSANSLVSNGMFCVLRVWRPGPKTSSALPSR